MRAVRQADREERARLLRRVPAEASAEGEAVSAYVFPHPDHVEKAEKILQELSRRGYLDDDWWCEAENHEAKDRPVNFVARIIQAAAEARR